MRAAAAFAAGLRDGGLLERTARVEANLYGSLALTGHGHGTDRAVLLGLSGELPDQIAPESIEPKLVAIRTAKSLRLASSHAVAFDDTRDLLPKVLNLESSHAGASDLQEHLGRINDDAAVR